MKLVTQNFKVGAIYCDVPNDLPLKTYLMFIKVDLDTATTYFKYVGGCNCYDSSDDELHEFDYPTEMYELSNEEIKDLVSKDIIKFN